MAKMIARYIGSGTLEDSYRIDLPIYTIINDLGDNKVEILVPDNLCDNNGKLDINKIRKIYRGTKWDSPDIGKDVDI